MKKLISLLICLMMVGALAAACASEGFGLQMIDYSESETSLDIVIYAKTQEAPSAEDFSIKLGSTEIPADKLSSYEESGNGTSWIVVLEPVPQDRTAREMVGSLMDDLISNLKSKDKMAIYNVDNEEVTEFMSSSSSIMPTVEQAINWTGGFKLYDAVQSALQKFKTGSGLGSHKCLVVISKGKDNGSNYSVSEAYKAVSEQSLTAYTVGLTKNVKDADAFKEWGSIARATESGLAITAGNKYSKERGAEIAKQIRENEQNLLMLSVLLSKIPKEAPTVNTNMYLSYRKGDLKLDAKLGDVNVDVPVPTPAVPEIPTKEPTELLPKPEQKTLTEGEPLADHVHEWADATCTEPKTCVICGETEGAPLGHDFEGTSFFTAGKCVRCDEIQKSGFETLIQENPVLIVMAAVLLILIIVMIVVLIKKKKKTGKVIAKDEEKKDDNENVTKPLESKLTVELTEKNTGKKYTGKIYGTSVKAGLQSELKLEGDSHISKKQMEFIWQHGILYVQDLNSLNGTRVNGEKIEKAVALKHNDIIRVGETDYIVNWYSN